MTKIMSEHYKNNQKIIHKEKWLNKVADIKTYLNQLIKEAECGCLSTNAISLAAITWERLCYQMLLDDFLLDTPDCCPNDDFSKVQLVWQNKEQYLECDILDNTAHLEPIEFFYIDKYTDSSKNKINSEEFTLFADFSASVIGRLFYFPYEGK